MESSVIRGEILDFEQACERLVGFIHEYNGLTTLERDTVINSVRMMEGEVSEFTREASPEPLFATPLSNQNLRPID